MWQAAIENAKHEVPKDMAEAQAILDGLFGTPWKVEEPVDVEMGLWLVTLDEETDSFIEEDGWFEASNDEAGTLTVEMP